MKKIINKILFDNSNELRYYHIDNKHYVFDNNSMKLMEISKPKKIDIYEKFIDRSIIGIPNTKMQKRANYAGYNAIVELTNNCNLRCVYCFRQKNLKNSHLNKQTCVQIINHIKAIDKNRKIEGDTIRVIFFGGEPLLNFNSLKFMVNELKNNIENYKLEYSMSTNGTLLTTKIIEFLIENNFSSQISFEGDKEIQNKSRPFVDGKGSYDVVNDKIKKIPKKYRSEFTIALSVSKITKNIDEIISKYIKYGFTTFNLLFIIDDIIGVNQLTYNEIDYIQNVIKKH